MWNSRFSLLLRRIYWMWYVSSYPVRSVICHRSIGLFWQSLWYYIFHSNCLASCHLNQMNCWFEIVFSSALNDGIVGMTSHKNGREPPSIISRMNLFSVHLATLMTYDFLPNNGQGHCLLNRINEWKNEWMRECIKFAVSSNELNIWLLQWMNESNYLLV